MENIDNFDNFLLSSHHTMLNEGKITDTMGKIGDKIKDLFGKGEITIGDKAEKAAKFNRYDIAKVIRQILPTGKDRADADSKLKYLKELDKKLMVAFGIGGIILVSYNVIPEVKDFIDNNFGANSALWVFWIVSLVATYLRNFHTMIKSDFHSLNLNIEYNKSELEGTTRESMVTVDFKYLSDIENKKANNIVYNAFIRKIEEYKGKEGIDIFYGKDTMFKNDPKYAKVPQFAQHFVTMNFYPVELLDLIDEFGKELEESAKKRDKRELKEQITVDRREGNDLDFYPAYYDMWIQRITMKQVLDLADRISKLEFSLMPIPVADYNEVKKRREEAFKTREEELDYIEKQRNIL